MAKNNRKNPSKSSKPSGKEQPNSPQDHAQDQIATAANSSVVKPTNLIIQPESKDASPKFNFSEFLKEVNVELSKVAWPSRQQLISESLAVLLMVIVAAVLVYLVDSLFGWAASQIF